METKLLKWDPQNLWNGVIHEDIKPKFRRVFKKKEKKKEHNKLAHDLKLERFCLLSFLLTAFLIR